MKPVASGLNRAVLASGVLFFALTACTPPDAGSDGGPALAEPEPEPLAVDVGDAVSGDELPADLLDAIIVDLAKQERLRSEDIKLLEGEAVTWPNGALGCPKPGEMYTQAEVPGYRVVLQSAGQEYDYRAARAGYFRRCDLHPRNQLPVD